MTDEQADVNRELYGANILVPPLKETQLKKFLRAVVGGLNALLLASSGLSFAIYFIQIGVNGTSENDDVRNS